ncbi:MAG TPA: glycosyltransferase family 9 protein [Ktedonobacteraceae bacterium]
MTTYTPPVQLPAEARILVVKLAAIGDLLLATPALRALRASYPRACIDLLVTPASADVLAGWEVIDQIIVLDKYIFDHPAQLLKNPLNLLQLRPLLRRLRAGRYDAVLLLHHLTLFFGRRKHQALLLATGAPYLVGLDNGHGWFLNVRVPDQGFGARHEAEYCLAVAEAVGAHTHETWLSIPLSEEERQQARQLVFGEDQEAAARPQEARPIIALHAGSGGYSMARRWAPERFAHLADTLYMQTGGQLLLVGGPEEAQLHAQIQSLLTSGVPVRSLAGRASLRVTAAVLELADLFVGNDAGPMHLATAVGTPTVAIFGLSNPQAWGPYTGNHPGRRAIVVRQDLPCMPCFYRGHELGTPQGCATRDCLATLGVEPVAVAARRLLRESGRVRAR